MLARIGARVMLVDPRIGNVRLGRGFGGRRAGRERSRRTCAASAARKRRDLSRPVICCAGSGGVDLSRPWRRSPTACGTCCSHAPRCAPAVSRGLLVCCACAPWTITLDHIAHRIGANRVPTALQRSDALSLRALACCRIDFGATPARRGAGATNAGIRGVAESPSFVGSGLSCSSVGAESRHW